MGCRSLIEFRYKGKDKGPRIYCHWGGDGRGKDLTEFINTVQLLNDRRFDDPEYLATKYTCWAAYDGLYHMEERQSKADYLSFLGVGICTPEPITVDLLAGNYGCEYYYIVTCVSSEKPLIEGWDINSNPTYKNDWVNEVEEYADSGD